MKFEARIPEGRKKAEIRKPKNGTTRIDSDLGLGPSFGFRPSDFGRCDFSNSHYLRRRGKKSGDHRNSARVIDLTATSRGICTKKKPPFRAASLENNLSSD